MHTLIKQPWDKDKGFICKSILLYMKHYQYKVQYKGILLVDIYNDYAH